MITNNTYQYGIKYRVVRVGYNKHLLFPVSLEGGLSDNVCFSTGKSYYPILSSKNSLINRYVVSKIYATEDLEYIYNYDKDTDILANSFFESYKDVLLLVDSSDANRLKINEINLKDFSKSKIDSTLCIDGTFSLILSEDTLNKLLECDNVNEIKLLLESYRRNIQGVKRIVDNQEKSKKKNEKNINVNVGAKKVPSEDSQEITYNGLRNTIKERILGHDKEIDRIAHKLYMNYKARPGDTISSILLVGPTGTGKTETIKVAADYMNLPFVAYNASKLVPQGIRGKTAEGLLVDLYNMSGKDMSKAEKGIYFLDEFDKLGVSDFDMKGSVRDGLLTLLGGEKIMLDGIEEPFNTGMLSRVAVGVFDKINEQEKHLGFSNSKPAKKLFETSEELRKKIVEKGYFTEEEITRFKTILRFDSLDIDTKRNILLNSKSSELANKRKRYKEQFGIDLLLSDDFIDAVFDTMSLETIGMRNLNNYIEEIIDEAEEEIISAPNETYKRLVLTKDTVDDHRKFNLS